MTRPPLRLLVCTVLWALSSGCPHAWSREGTIERAARRDWQEWMARRNCKLDGETWMRDCKYYKSAYGNNTDCPEECRPQPGEFKDVNEDFLEDEL